MKFLTNAILIFFFTVIAFSASNAQTPKYQQPILISSAGQSADVILAGMLFKKLNLNYKTVNLAKESDLEGIKTLVVVPGFSSKGLGAAGISREDEMDRVVALINSAKEKKIKIVMLHIGGNARRGNQSDDFNKLVAESSSYMIVVNQGDEDKFFSNIAADKKVTIKLVEKIVDATEPIKELFN